MKTFNRMILSHLHSQVQPCKDNLQFAYLELLDVDDFLHALQEHLKTNKLSTKARLLFVDFSSVLNAIQPHLLKYKIMNMKINVKLIVWIQNLPSDRLHMQIVTGPFQM